MCCCFSLAKLCLTIWDPMNCSIPGLPVLYYLPVFAQIQLRWWCYLIISSSALFSFCLQSFPVSGYFLMSRVFSSSGQSIGTSASTLVLPINIQGWFPLWLTTRISLQSKELSRVFSRTTIQKHQFSGGQPSLWSSCHIHTWILEKP